jgi:predicted aconitase
MHLTKEEERIYEGEEGWARKKAMEILVTIGEINNASQLIPIQSAHISGASYKTIGEALEFITSLEGTRVKVKSTLNPTGVDRANWKAMNVSEEFVTKQRDVINAYENLGIAVECTCIPYLIGNTPKFGEHVAWAESSAVLYANSVLGARTNMEGAPSALAAALIGKTPLYGLHLTENREPELRVRVRVPCALRDSDYSALGSLIGDLVGNKIPVIELTQGSSPSTDELKYLGAAIGATGSVGMYHVTGITPEADSIEVPAETVEIGTEDLQRFYAEAERGDVIAIGCPHCSAAELRRISELLEAESNGRNVRKDFFIFTARAITDRMQDVVRKIEGYGAKVICDTCFVVSPAFEHYRCVITNSGKMLRYVPLLCGGADVRLCKTEECVRLAF